jgi:predicted transcriptional regulator
MKIRGRAKVSVSLSSELLGAIDATAKRSGMSRSAVMEECLRYGVARREQEALDREVEAYYRGRSAQECAEDQAVARASLRAARRLRIDEPAPRPHPRPGRGATRR